MTRPDNYEAFKTCDQCAYVNMMRVPGDRIKGLGCFLGEPRPRKKVADVDDEGWKLRWVFGAGCCPSFSRDRSPAE